MRSFIDEGPEIAGLLKGIVKTKSIQPDYVKAAAVRFPGECSDPCAAAGTSRTGGPIERT